MANRCVWSAVLLVAMGLTGCVIESQPAEEDPTDDEEDGEPTPLDPPACALNTAEHCGACGYACNPGMACVEGACERAVFATSEVFDGNLGGLEGAHAKCQRLATAAGLAHEFKAWISDHDTGPLDTFTRSPAAYRMIGDSAPKIADSFEDLVTTKIGETFPGLETRIDRDEAGRIFTATPYAWTGTSSSGIPSEIWYTYPEPVGVETCFEWTTAELVDPWTNPCWGMGTCPMGMTGTTQLVAASGEPLPGELWTFGGKRFCNETYRLYCFEQE